MKYNNNVYYVVKSRGPRATYWLQGKKLVHPIDTVAKDAGIKSFFVTERLLERE